MIIYSCTLFVTSYHNNFAFESSLIRWKDMQKFILFTILSMLLAVHNILLQLSDIRGNRGNWGKGLNECYYRGLTESRWVVSWSIKEENHCSKWNLKHTDPNRQCTHTHKSTTAKKSVSLHRTSLLPKRGKNGNLEEKSERKNAREMSRSMIAVQGFLRKKVSNRNTEVINCFQSW